MNFFRKLAQMLAGTKTPVGGDVGLYYYVQAHRSGEVVRVRINPMNDLSEDEENGGYYVRKVLVGSRSFERMELELHFTKDRKIAETKATGGKIVTQADWEADQAAHPPKSN